MFVKLILKWVTFVFLTLFWVTPEAKADLYVEITSTIQQLSPHIDNNTARLYGIIIEKYSLEYGIDWRIAVAIFQQESSFRLDAVNYKSADFGIGQLSWKWHIKPKELDLQRLLNDPDYAIHQTFKILANLKQSYNTGSKGWLVWYTRYHSFTPKIRKRYYYKLVRWFRVINGRKDKEKTSNYNSGSKSTSKENVRPRGYHKGYYGRAWMERSSGKEVQSRRRLGSCT